MLVTVIKDGELIRMPMEQAKEEELFIVGQDFDGKVDEMKETLKMPVQEKKHYSLDYKKNNVVNELVEHFNWKISRGRRDNNMTRRQLAVAAGISESDLTMIEQGQLPKDDFVIIKKIEEVLKVNLRKNPQVERQVPAQPTLADLQKKKEEREQKQDMVGDIEIID